MRQVLAYIGLGANVGDARRTLTEAVAALAALPGARPRGVSRLYRTAPVGVADQPDFLNAVAAIEVAPGPDPAAGATALLVRLKELERSFGRRRRRRWGPRELDLDLLLFGGERISVARPPEAAPASAEADPGAATRLLEVPHPAMRERLFVLAPLADLAPDLVPPGWDETVESARQRRAAIEGPDAVRPVGDWDLAARRWTPPARGTVAIRRATPADADEMARVHTASSEAAYRGIAPPDPAGLERRRAMWQDVLGRPGGASFVAVAGGEMVGLLNVGPARPAGPEHPGPGHPGTEHPGTEHPVDAPALGEIRTIYVLEAWWGTGAGQALLERAHEELAADFEEAELTVLAANPRARRFYERNGWELHDVLVEPHFGGIPTEVARYRRRLGGRA